jgi:hypothetical protein
MAIAKKSQTASEGLSLKSFLDASASTKLEFVGSTTNRGNPLFTNGVQTLPISLGLLNYYIKQGLVIVEEDDSLDCPKGWKSVDGAWTPKAKAQQEL